jgi:hypothetical protein
MKFYIATEPSDYECGMSREVESGDCDMGRVAKDEASRIYDEEGVDQHRAVDVYVAISPMGCDCCCYTIKRYVEITHTIQNIKQVDIKAEA